eukprot:1185647-Prorocentrum_minimum.AAC.10
MPLVATRWCRWWALQPYGFGSRPHTTGESQPGRRRPAKRPPVCGPSEWIEDGGSRARVQTEPSPRPVVRHLRGGPPRAAVSAGRRGQSPGAPPSGAHPESLAPNDQFLGFP